MKLKVILFLTWAVLSLNLLAQNSQLFVGDYFVRQTCFSITHGGYRDTVDYIVEITPSIVDTSNIHLALIQRGEPVDAVIVNDTVFEIPLHKFPFFLGDTIYVSGDGYLSGDSIIINHISGSKLGLMECVCKGVQKDNISYVLDVNEMSDFKFNLSEYYKPRGDSIQAWMDEIPEWLSFEKGANGYTFSGNIGAFEEFNSKKFTVWVSDMKDTLDIDFYLNVKQKSDINIKFAPINATWYYTEHFNYSDDVDYIMLKSEKDTVINDTLCRKITKRHQLFDNFRPKDEYIADVNNKVYFYDTIFNQFQILYDFNTQEGDYWDITIKLNPTNQIDTIRVKVDSIRNITINDSVLEMRYVTYYRLSHEGDPEKHLKSQIIEKIGDINYMFYWYYLTTDYIDFYAGNHSRGLRCYEDDDFGLYHHDQQYDCGYVYVGIDELYEGNLYDIYPNPTNGLLIVTSRDNNNHEFCFELLNISGKKLMRRKCDKTSVVDLNQYPQGLYFIKLHHKNGTVNTFKIIKN